MALTPYLAGLVTFLIDCLLIFGVLLANRWLLTVFRVFFLLIIIFREGIRGESMRSIQILICDVHFYFNWFFIINNWSFGSKFICLICRLYLCSFTFIAPPRLFLHWIQLLTNTHALCLLHHGVTLEELFIFMDHLSFLISLLFPPAYWVYHAYVRFLRLWVPIPIRLVSLIWLSALPLTAPSNSSGWEHLGESTRVLFHLIFKLVLEEVLKVASITMHTLLIHVLDILLDLSILVEKRRDFFAFLFRYLHLNLSVLLPGVIMSVWMLIRQANTFSTVRFLTSIR